MDEYELKSKYDNVKISGCVSGRDVAGAQVRECVEVSCIVLQFKPYPAPQSIFTS